MTHTNLYVRLTVILCLFASSNLFAATHTVCGSGCDFSTVHAAIISGTVMPGDIIRITDATFTEQSITISKDNLTIEGTGQNSTILQAGASRGSASDRIFTVNTSITVTIRDMTIRYGNASGRGGAVLMNDMCSITMNRVTLDRNDAAQDGGAIASASGTSGITLIMDDCVVSHNYSGLSNTSADGGGIYQAGGNLTMTGCSVFYNKVGDDGGGVYLNQSGSSNSMTNCTISNNFCGQAGGPPNSIDGGGFQQEDGTTTLTNCTIAANYSPGFAGGMGIFDGSIHMRNNIFADNSAGVDANDVCLSGGVVGTNDQNLAESCHGFGCPTWDFTADPGLTPLARCANDDPHTHGISSGSVAENAGSNTGAPANDICGLARSSPPDLGSFEIGSALPVSFTFFTGKLVEETVQLRWETAFEKNNAGFDVERSYDGYRFENIGTVFGAGESFEPIQYDFSDIGFDKNRTQIYYRLKQTDFDGNYLYSKTNIIQNHSNSLIINYIYSNSNTSFVTFSNQNEYEISVRLFDFSGKNVLNNIFYPTPGTNVLELNINDLPSGIYALQLQSGSSKTTGKIIK